MLRLRRSPPRRALLPVGAALFSRVTFAGLALNFAAIPLMAVAQIAGMAVVLLCASRSRLAAAAGWLAHVGAEGLVRSADLVECVPVRHLAGRAAALVRGRRLLRRRSWPSGLALASAPDRRRAGPLSASAIRSRPASIAAAPRRPSGSSVEPSRLVTARGDGRCTSRSSTWGRATPRWSGFPAARRCSSMPAACLRQSSFDIGDRVVGAGPASRRHSPARRARRSRTATPTTSAAPRRSCASSGRATSGKAFRCPVRRRWPALRGAAAARGRPLDQRPGERSVHDRRRRGDRPPSRRCPTGSGRTSATTIRSCSSCAGATCRSC